MTEPNTSLHGFWDRPLRDLLNLLPATPAGLTSDEATRRLAMRPPETEFGRGIRQFGLMITRVIMVLVLFVLLVNIILARPLLESFLFSVALAVGMTPEMMPMIITVTLAQGARRMAPTSWWFRP